MRNFSVPDPAELQKWKEEMRASHVRNEHYDSPPLSPRGSRHASHKPSDAKARCQSHSHANSKQCDCLEHHRKSHSKKHTRKHSAPASSVRGSRDAKDSDSTKSSTRSAGSRHQRSKSEYVGAKSPVGAKSARKAHVWDASFATAAVSRPGVSRSNSVSHSIHTNPTVFDGERETVRDNNIHAVRARQRYGDGSHSFSFSARSLPLVGSPVGST